MKNLLFDPPESACVLYAPGLPGGGNHLLDRSQHGNHGTITGALWSPLAGGFWCLDFDGVDDVVTVPDKPSLSITSEATVMTWFKLTDVADWRYVIAKDGVTDDVFMMRVNQSTGLLYCRITSGANGDSIVSPAAVNDGKWRCGGFTYDSSWLNLYLDGVSVTAPVAKTITVPVNNSPLTIGGWSDPDRKFKGQIAIPRVYNRRFNALEIRNAFDREKSLFGVW